MRAVACFPPVGQTPYSEKLGPAQTCRCGMDCHRTVTVRPRFIDTALLPEDLNNSRFFNSPLTEGGLYQFNGSFGIEVAISASICGHAIHLGLFVKQR